MSDKAIHAVTVRVFFLVLLGFVFIPAVQAACWVASPASNCPAPQQVARVAASSNAHVAGLSYTSFNSVICCDNYDNSGGNDIFSYTDAGGGQGHACPSGQCPNDITGNFQSCSAKSSCDSSVPEVCVLSISDSGGSQGHVGTCSAYSTKICCTEPPPGPSTCADAATNGYSCPDDSWDGPVGDGWHCDVTNGGRCCPESQWWNGVACQPTVDCRNDTPVQCPVDPQKTASYLGDVGTTTATGCVNDPTGDNNIDDRACCDFGFDDGRGFSVHGYQNILDITLS